MHPGIDAAVAMLVPAVADEMHALLVQRADVLEGSEGERELASITDAIEAYESVRWPNGKVDGGKGGTKDVLGASMPCPRLTPSGLSSSA
jgi:hypothetical protein